GPVPCRPESGVCLLGLGQRLGPLLQRLVVLCSGRLELRLELLHPLTGGVGAVAGCFDGGSPTTDLLRRGIHRLLGLVEATLQLLRRGCFRECLCTVVGFGVSVVVTAVLVRHCLVVCRLLVRFFVFVDGLLVGSLLVVDGLLVGSLLVVDGLLVGSLLVVDGLLVGSLLVV